MKTTTKIIKTTKAAKAKTSPTAQPDSECPKGGKHEWMNDGDVTTCKNCLEPKDQSKGKKPKTAKAAKSTKPKKERRPRKLSAIDAAAKVLADAKDPMACKELIDAMAKKGLWTSPGGKTPHATLYSAIIREIAVKGKEARFVKTERGKFTTNA
jgi:hypothetical protein